MNQLGDSPSVDGRVLGYAQTWHRANPDYNNRCIANEYISGRIGIFLGLPIPPFAITHDKDENVYFSSLDFNFNRAILPPIVPDRCVACLPELCTGILLFDILIANEDRHEANLVTDSVSSPKFIHVYDHDQALLSGRNSEGVRRLKTLWDHLGITGGSMGGNRHVFLDLLSNAGLFSLWEERIDSIPNWFIDEACDYAESELDVTPEESKTLKAFLKHRKVRISDIIKSNRDEFKGITNWPTGLFQ